MPLPTETKSWVMVRKPTGLPTYAGESPTFVLETKTLPDLESGQVLVEALYLSNDPSQRTWMSLDVPEERHYGKVPRSRSIIQKRQRSPTSIGMHQSFRFACARPCAKSFTKDSTNSRIAVSSIQSGSVVRGRGIVKILKSTSQQFKEGQFGYGMVGWSQYNVLDADAVKSLLTLPGGMDMTLHMGTLGLTGMTAYFGLIDIMGLRKGENIMISGAAGATGSMAVRIARNLLGAGKIIGTAGTDEKCRWVEKLGADLCTSCPVLHRP